MRSVTWVVPVALRFLRAQSSTLSLSTLMATVGLALGVAVLTVSMAVISGYESSLRLSVTDFLGDVFIVRRQLHRDELGALTNEIQSAAPEVAGITPFAFLEAMVVSRGRVAGVVLEALELGTVQAVLSIQNRIVSGNFLTPKESESEWTEAVVGEILAQEMGLSVGDTIHVVVPLKNGIELENFKPQAKKFKIVGLVRLGQYDFDKRYIFTTLDGLSGLVAGSGQLSGVRMRLSNYQMATATAAKLEQHLGFGYTVKSWFDVNKNLFSAIDYERRVLFLVLGIVIVAASFHVATTLATSVVQKTREVSILRAMGASGTSVTVLFMCQGLAIGVMGILGGLLLGGLGIKVFLYMEHNWKLLPPEIYRLTALETGLRYFDLVAIIGFAMGVALVAAWGPSRRSAKLSVSEGLRYE